MPRAPIFQDTPINYQLSLPQMTMEANARLYNCARPLCHAQAMICQPCDRGHIYCSPSCSQQARHANRKIAQRRYEQSYKGRRTAALRQARFRKNQRLTQLSKLQQESCSAKKVTHHGSAETAQSASLPDAPASHYWLPEFRDFKRQKKTTAQGRCCCCGAWVKNFRLRI